MKNRIGIVGGGQLGRMLGFEAKRMGFTVIVIDPTPNSPAGQVVDEQILADFKDGDAIRKLADKVDFLTFEVELANADALNELSKNGVSVNPSPKTLNIIKDKLKQKEFLQKSGIPVADFVQVETKEDILKVARKFGYPFLLKARFDAYDGRGNALIKNEKEIDGGLKKLEGRALYVEKFVPFIKELAVVVARSTKGEIATYPVVETVHKNNILHTLFAPARIDLKIQNKARKLASKVMEQLKGAGVFGIEMFLTKDGKVLINEIAPRVHNSGHYTIEASITNQFEQHIRAITGLPLGKTDLLMSAVMVNILGDRSGEAQVKGLEKALAIPNVAVHIYGKAETRVERKMGHITVIDKSLTKALKKANLAREFIKI
jgi:5-(carboxyamino)imidazole ribonucleotide synthase